MPGQDLLSSEQVFGMALQVAALCSLLSGTAHVLERQLTPASLPHNTQGALRILKLSLAEPQLHVGVGSCVINLFSADLGVDLIPL